LTMAREASRRCHGRLSTQGRPHSGRAVIRPERAIAKAGGRPGYQLPGEVATVGDHGGDTASHGGPGVARGEPPATYAALGVATKDGIEMGRFNSARDPVAPAIRRS
jgi:hypothetical protein